MPEAAARGGWWRRRPGIRAQLLVLLVPGIAALLAFDSWTDYRDHAAAVTTAYDQALLEPLVALDDNINVDASGELGVVQPFAVLSMFEATEAKRKYLHVGLVPLDPAGKPIGPERVLLGPADLPPEPAGAQRAAVDEGHGGAIVLYDARYRGLAVRMGSVRRVVQDGAGRPHELHIQAAEGTSWRERARDAIFKRELIEDGRMVLVMTVLLWVGLAWTLRPLERLRDQLRLRSPRQLAPLDVSGVPGEVAPLVEAVNRHIADHRQVLEQQAQFLADASHQLRTPLAIMMTQAGYALREQDPRRTQETLQAIMTQLSRSRRLAEQLLAMAHASRAPEDGAPGALVDLNAIAREVVLQYLALAHEKNQDLGWADARGEEVQAGAEGVPAVPVRAQAAELHEALANLLHNAIRHTPAGGRITVAVHAAEGVAVAEVRDSGPGLPAQRHEAVFRRFHRTGDQAAGGGAGLGLAIARAYARRNGGDITFADGELRPDGGRGLCARLQLPLGGTPA